MSTPFTDSMDQITELERYPDPIDQAAARTDADNAAHIKHARQALAPQQEPRADGTYEHTECIEPDCGEELPQERLKMGRVRCTSCQALLEERQKRFRR